MSHNDSQPAIASWQRWILVPLVVAGLALITVAQHRFLTSGAANRDFMALWCAGRAVIEGIDAYDPDAWMGLRAQYGSTWMPSPRLPYPIWVAWLMVPFGALDLDWAAACWLVMCELIVGASCLALMTQLGRHKPSGLEFGLLLLGAFAFRGTLISLGNGQFTLVLLAVLVAFVLLIKRGRPFWAGLVLCGIAFKPSSFVLFAPLIALALLQRRAWRALAGAAGGGATLLLAGWLIEPGWLARWLSVRDTTEVTFLRTSTVWGLAFDLAPAWWPAVGLALTVLVTVFCGVLAFRRRELSMVHVVSLALGGSLLVTPYVWVYEHALLLIPMVLVYAWMRRRKLAWVVWISMTVVVPWTLYWVAQQRGRDTASLLVPLLVSVVFGVLSWRQKNQSVSE